MPSVVKFSPNWPLGTVQAEPLGPDVEILAGKGVDGLEGAAVVLGVGHLVAVDAERAHGHRSLDLRLDDRRALEAAGPLSIEGSTDVDRQQACRHSDPSSQTGAPARTSISVRAVSALRRRPPDRVPEENDAALDGRAAAAAPRRARRAHLGVRAALELPLRLAGTTRRRRSELAGRAPAAAATSTRPAPATGLARAPRLRAATKQPVTGRDLGEQLVADGQSRDGRLDAGLAGQVAYVGHLRVGHQGDDGARAAGASGAARPVQVGLVLGRRVGVDDQADVVDVDAARGDVGGDQRLGGAVGEGREVSGPGVLRQVAVQVDRRARRRW